MLVLFKSFHSRFLVAEERELAPPGAVMGKPLKHLTAVGKSPRVLCFILKTACKFYIIFHIYICVWFDIKMLSVTYH